MTKRAKKERLTSILYLRCKPSERKKLADIAKRWDVSEAAVVRALILQQSEIHASNDKEVTP